MKMIIRFTETLMLGVLMAVSSEIDQFMGISFQFLFDLSDVNSCFFVIFEGFFLRDICSGCKRALKKMVSERERGVVVVAGWGDIMDGGSEALWWWCCNSMGVVVRH
ncbi:hypothetical protein FRX31_015433 [Thalictrum thalictroides]|uniref:Transmembrane protein n=1 Tax=Thalictrum thalictroides TaxID=46969 RepID=A0A7J6WED7_THATH|nr:hypothetical protein FRX31_015433 [Thalictrum thalictroides]